MKESKTILETVSNFRKTSKKRDDRKLDIKLKPFPYISAESPTTPLLPSKKDAKKKKPQIAKPKKVVLQRNKKTLHKDEEIFTVVRGLKSFLRQNADHSLYEEIEKHVLIVSAMSIEASYMIYYYYTDLLQKDPNINISEVPKFREFFASLKSVNIGETANIVRKRSKRYFNLRSAYGLQQYDGSNKTNVIAAAADAYQTNLSNNITDHMYKRVKSFFRAVCPNTESFKTLDNLFNKKSPHQVNPELISSLDEHLNFVGNFHNLSKEWWSFIPFTYRLQQWHREKNLKAFKVFPILSHRRHFIHYDGQSFQQLLRTFKASPSKYSDFRAIEDEFWRKYFNIEQVETKNHKFFGSIRTDGVTVSITMKRIKASVCTDKNAKIKSKLEAGQYQHAYAFDPGERLQFPGISKDLKTGQETNIKYSSASFRYDAGEHHLTQKFHRWTNNVLNEIRSDRENYPDHASSIADPDVFLSFQLKHFTQVQNVMSEKRIAKLRFERYIRRSKTIDAIARKLLNCAKNFPHN